jgi:hypothetical protein
MSDRVYGFLRGGRQAAALSESLHSLASGPCPPVRGGPLAPCPVARSCRTEREPPIAIPPKLQTYRYTVNVM